MAGARGSNLTTKTFDALREDILTGRLAPDSPLKVGALAAEYGVSLSVVREALTRLLAHGLAVSSPNQGFRVLPLSRVDLLDLTDLRATLEGMALQRSIAAGDLHWEADVVAAHHVLAGEERFAAGSALVRAEWTRAHDAFHRALVAACGSPRLLGVLDELNDAASTYRQWAVGAGRASGRDARIEHRQLMELATARKAPEAADALRAHMYRTTDLLLASAGENAAPADPSSVTGAHGGR